MPSTQDLSALRAAVDGTPLIDNHAHPLLKSAHLRRYPLLSITSEARGKAAKDAKQSLSHVRATRQLARVLGCEASWDVVEAAVERRRAENPTAWTARCLHGIETILIDDGLDDVDRVEGYAWHDTFTNSGCKRIVRIETLAEKVIAELCESSENQGEILFKNFFASFSRKIDKCIKDPEVVGFKSIICYRGGLDIPLGEDRDAAVNDLEYIVGDQRRTREPFKRLDSLAINHFIVHYTAGIIAVHPAPSKKPIQFHTGLGDNDITLTKSSPSHLQDFIRIYPDVPIVLLHAGYPWTRETAYLATMYANVYADIGEVFPCLSRGGQENVVKEMLELCPWSKILCSTDGHWFPEIYLLATMQIREALKTVLEQLVHTEQLDEKQAVQLAQDVLFNNSQKLYNLEVKTSLPSFAQLPSQAHPIATSTVTTRATEEDILQKFRSLDAKWLRIYWNDYTASPRCRLIPMKQVYKTLEAGGTINPSVTKAALGLLQTDTMIPQITPTGGYILRPDWGTLRQGPVESHISCQGEFRELAEDGSEEGKEAVLCPRTLLRRTVERARADHGLEFLVGFEIEFVVVERNPDAACPPSERYRQLRSADGHAWTAARAVADWGAEGSIGAVMDEVIALLDAAGIDVEMFHPESAAGQFELVLAAQPALEACDGLLHTRQILESAAARHGLRMTLHPKPLATSCGTAAHAHLSVRSVTRGDGPDVYEPFYAGILRHLRELTAFTYASPASYERAVDGCWAGGRWVTWGTLNKEVPLRKCEGAHWELKTLDGLANPYLAVAAVLAAGVNGVVRDEVLVWKDCAVDPALLSNEERRDLGIRERLPADLREALDKLSLDPELRNLLGPELVERYIDVKHAELEFLEPMNPEERRQWIMERY